MIVGITRLSLYFPASSSLKDKRQGLRRLIDRVRSKFNAAVAEVSDQDSWQRAGVGICVVSNEAEHVHAMLDRIAAFVEELYVAQLLARDTEIIHYGDEGSADG